MRKIRVTAGRNTVYVRRGEVATVDATPRVLQLLHWGLLLDVDDRTGLEPDPVRESVQTEIKKTKRKATRGSERPQQAPTGSQPTAFSEVSETVAPVPHQETFDSFSDEEGETL